MENIFQPNQHIIILYGLQRDTAYRLSTDMLQRLLQAYGHNLGITDIND